MRFSLVRSDVRPDDEIYNMLMAWVASQRFSQGARRFVVNTNLNSVCGFLSISSPVAGRHWSV